MSTCDGHLSLITHHWKLWILGRDYLSQFNQLFALYDLS